MCSKDSSFRFKIFAFLIDRIVKLDAVLKFGWGSIYQKALTGRSRTLFSRT